MGSVLCHRLCRYLYHLNPDYPKNPEFRKRMETIDEEVNEKTLAFMEKATQADKPFVELRAPTLMNLRMDPFELAQDICMDYQRPRQKPGSFNLNRVMEAVTAPAGSGR